jgi:hypothetical protein
MSALRSIPEVAKAAVDAKERRQGIQLTTSYRGMARGWAAVLIPERDREIREALLAALADADPLGRVRALAEKLKTSP